MSYPPQGPGHGGDPGDHPPHSGASGRWHPSYDPGGDHGAPPHLGGYSPYPQGGHHPAQGNSDEQTMALLSHLGGLLLGFLGPLIVYLIKKDESAYVRHHATEALNFQITVFIAAMVSSVLMFVVVGFLLLPVVAVVDIVLCIMAAMAANRGEWYRYPISIRLVS
jgi:uncharacterized protein